MISPFELSKTNPVFQDIFSMSKYWFIQWKSLKIYTKAYPNQDISRILDMLGITKSIQEINDMLENGIDVLDINNADTYILYKLCREFALGEKIVAWKCVSEVNGIETTCSVLNWLASDEDHILWITMKILNGFGDFNPYRLPTWKFWQNLCFLAQNRRASKLFKAWT